MASTHTSTQTLKEISKMCWSSVSSWTISSSLMFWPMGALSPSTSKLSKDFFFCPFCFVLWLLLFFFRFLVNIWIRFGGFEIAALEIMLKRMEMVITPRSLRIWITWWRIWTGRFCLNSTVLRNLAPQVILEGIQFSNRNVFHSNIICN